MRGREQVAVRRGHRTLLGRQAQVVALTPPHTPWGAARREHRPLKRRPARTQRFGGQRVAAPAGDEASLSNICVREGVSPVSTPHSGQPRGGGIGGITRFNRGPSRTMPRGPQAGEPKRMSEYCQTASYPCVKATLRHRRETWPICRWATFNTRKSAGFAALTVADLPQMRFLQPLLEHTRRTHAQQSPGLFQPQPVPARGEVARRSDTRGRSARDQHGHRRAAACAAGDGPPHHRRERRRLGQVSADQGHAGTAHRRRRLADAPLRAAGRHGRSRAPHPADLRHQGGAVPDRPHRHSGGEARQEAGRADPRPVLPGLCRRRRVRRGGALFPAREQGERLPARLLRRARRDPRPHRARVPLLARQPAGLDRAARLPEQLHPAGAPPRLRRGVRRVLHRDSTTPTIRPPAGCRPAPRWAAT